MPVTFNRIVNLSADERGPNRYEKAAHDLEIAKVRWSIADMGAAKQEQIKAAMKKKKKKGPPATPDENVGAE